MLVNLVKGVGMLHTDRGTKRERSFYLFHKLAFGMCFASVALKFRFFSISFETLVNSPISSIDVECSF